jgi:hypothetical protein
MTSRPGPLLLALLALLALVALLALAGCPEKKPFRTQTTRTKPSPEIPVEKPAKQPAKKAPPASRAGSPDLLAPLNEEARTLLIQGVKARSAKKLDQAVKLLDQALQKQPDNVELHWQRALARAANKEIDGALADLERALHGDYPAYARLAQTLPELKALQAPPHRAELYQLLTRARSEHVNAIKNAKLFLGSRRRLQPAKRSENDDAQELPRSVGGFLYKDRVLQGDQGLYGYLPETGRYVSVAQGAPTPEMGIHPSRGAVVGFIRSPDGQIVTYVWVERVGTFGNPDDADEGYFTHMQAHAVVVDLTRMELLDRRRGVESDVNEYYGGQDCEPHMDQRVTVTLHESGIWQLVFKTNKCSANAAESEVVHKRHVVKYAAGEKPAKTARPRRGDSKLATFTVQVCGHSTGLPKSVKVASKKTLEVDELEVALPCAGRAWASPDRKWVAFAPGKGCQREEEPMSGLWRWSVAEKQWHCLASGGTTHAVRWLDGGAMMVQLGQQVLYVDPSRDRSQLLGSAASYLRANMPFLDRCGLRVAK